jgi:hypothetical protein
VQTLFTDVHIEGREILIPDEYAASNWSGGSSMRGMAVSGALARAVESAVIALAPSLRPARWTVDISSAVPMRECWVRTQVLRSGRRICLAEGLLGQGERVLARGRGLFLSGGGLDSGFVWSPQYPANTPPDGLAPDPMEPRIYFSESEGWTRTAASHRNADPKQIWQWPVGVVPGEQPSPFTSAAVAADLASVVVNWGTEGLSYLNADLTLSLARVPAPGPIGLAVRDRIQSDGISVGSAWALDRNGIFGICTVTALANAYHAVDPADRDRTASLD